MKKRICSLILTICVIVSSAFAFAGCDLIHENSKRFYDEAIAYVGEEPITRSELLNMFNYYYYTNSYYQYYDEQTVYEMTVEALIKNKIILNEAKKVVELSVAHKNEIWQSVFDFIDTQIDTYEDQIRTIYKAPARETSTEEETEYKVFKEYERSVAGGEDNVKVETVINSTFTAPNKDDNYYRFLAYKKYLSGLVKTAENNSNNAGSTEEVFQVELDRLYKYYEEAKYIERYWVYKKQQLVISDDSVLNEFDKLVNTQLQKYAVEGTYKKNVTNTSNTDLILLHETGEYFTVQHLLLSFNSDADEFLKAQVGYVTSADASTSVEQTYVDAFLQLRADYANDNEHLNMDYVNPNTGKTNEDDNGNKITKTLSDVTTAIDEALNTYRTIWQDGAKTSAEKEAAGKELVKTFFELKFCYSKDSNVTDITTLHNIMGYALPVDSSVDSGLYPEFTEVSHRLLDQYNNPSASEGKYNIISCDSQAGLHYLIINNVYTAGPVCDSNIEDMKSTYLSFSTDQTVYDYIFDKLLKAKEDSVATDISAALYAEYNKDNKIKVLYDLFEDVQ